MCLRGVVLSCSRFDGVLEHVLRIDRVLRQPMGHLLLVGEAGAGKTVLSRFVSWMNGLGIFQASYRIICRPCCYRLRLAAQPHRFVLGRTVGGVLLLCIGPYSRWCIVDGRALFSVMFAAT